MDNRVFMNFLEKVNSAKNFKDLADIITDGFLTYNHALCCWCVMFDVFTNQIEIKEFKSTKICDKQILIKSDEIQQTVIDLYEGFSVQDLEEYLTTVSCKDTILYPMTFRENIIGYIGMIGKDNDFYKENIENVKLTTAFINARFEILSIQSEKKEYKPLDLKFEKLRPKFIIEEVLQSFEELRKQKNIIFNYTLSDIIIEADKLMLKQVIYNLISNALKSSKENSIISIVTYISEKNEFIFEIHDKGEGMSKEELHKLFNFFTKVDTDQTNIQSCIGLALCRKILQAHGGEIYVKSKPQQGSTFWFAVPIKKL